MDSRLSPCQPVYGQQVTILTRLADRTYAFDAFRGEHTGIVTTTGEASGCVSHVKKSLIKNSPPNSLPGP